MNAIYSAVEAGFDKLPSEANVKQGKVNYAVDTGAADAYVVNLPHAPASYADGLEVNVKISAANTGACTINVNSLGAVAIKTFDGSDPAAGALPAGAVVPLRHNETNFRIVGIAPGAQAVTAGASAFMQTVLDDTTAAAARTTLGVAIGTDVQAYDAQLADVAGLAVTDGGFIVGDGSNFVLESGATVRTSLGLAIGTDVQAYDADLAALAGIAVAGILARTGAGTAAARTLTGTANEITVANGDGSGTPTFSLPTGLTFTGKTVTGGSYASPTITTSPTAAGATWTDLGAVTTVDINGGTIDGATIATSDITVGAGKTLNVSAGTLTLANDQISGNALNGGTPDFDTINEATAATGVTTDGVLHKDSCVDADNLPAPNLVIDGEMRLAFAGTLTGQGGASAYTALSLWNCTTNLSAGRFTSSRDTTVKGVAGYALKIDCTTAEDSVAAGEICSLRYFFEGSRIQHLLWGTASAKSVTLSFRFRSPKTGTHYATILRPDSGRSYISTFTVAAADTLESFTLTIPGDTGGTEHTNDETARLYLLFPLVAGSDFQGTADQWGTGNRQAGSGQQNLLDNTANDIYLTDVKLEVGSVATPFVPDSLDETTRKAARYIQQHALDSASGEAFLPAYNVSTTVARAQFTYSEMRTAPAFTFTAGDTWLVGHEATTTAGTSIAAANIGKRSAAVQLTVAAGLTAGQGSEIRRDTTDTTNVLLDARF